MEDKNKINYRNTLNLPKTDFPMKANLTQREPEIQKNWEKINLFKKIREKSTGSDKFIFHDGPPYANGPIHLGHLLNKVLKDIVVRSKTMEGYDVEFIPGWDCHGLPIEHKVLKELGDEAKELSKYKIRQKCKNYAKKFVKLQTNQMKRLGTTADYKNPYLTMTPDYEAGVLEVFSKLLENNLVYRDLKPVHWSIENQTALADAELEYHEKTDKSIYVLFKILNPQNLPLIEKLSDKYVIYLMIWTTTPWTLPANLAVAVSPTGEYGLYKIKKENRSLYTIVVDNLAELVFAKNESNYEKIAQFKGSELVGSEIEYIHPFIERNGKVVSADYVTFDDGTGLVHTAPGHGLEDYQTGLNEGLDIYCPVKEDGTFDETVPEWLANQNVWKANDLIVQNLEQSGSIFYQEEFTHSYPHDWRSKTPTIFRATEQWFVGVDISFTDDGKSLRELALESVENKITFYPDWGKNRLRGMLEARPDWCISRQRSWGLPIPSFTDKKGRSLLTRETLKWVIEKIRQKGSNIWFTATAEELLEGYDPSVDDESPEWIGEVKLDELEKGSDIFDVWFESGSSWHSVLEARKIGYPADLYLEGSDQHRGWFQLSLLPSLGNTNMPPFKSILTHGFMVDAQRKKMSKSGGNALDVDEILKTFGADICRWWVSSLKYTNDIKVDWDFFNNAAEEYRKVRNTIRFLLGNIYDFNPEKDTIAFNEDDKYSLDYWAYLKLMEFVDETVSAYKEFDYKRASDQIFKFCYDNLSAVYFSSVKDRLYCDISSSRRRRRTQTVLHKTSDCLIKLLTPILVHTSEEAFKSLNKFDKLEHSVHLERFPESERYEQMSIWDDVMELRNKSLKSLEDYRDNTDITNPLDTGISLTLNEKEYKDIKPFEPELADLCGISRYIVNMGDSFNLEIVNLLDEPKCERSWKRDGTVKQRSDGGLLSDRDAEALGIT